MIVLVLGGARSGKSEVAERVAAGLAAPVTFLATAVPDDPDFAQRIAVHRERRPAHWTTVECGADLAAALVAASGTALVDSLGTWVAAHGESLPDVDELATCLTARPGHTVLVSEEVGLGVHPSSAAGRRFRDILGDANRKVASCSDHVLLVVAGRLLELESTDTSLARLLGEGGDQ